MNQIEKMQSPLTVRKHNEHKAVELALKSLCHSSVANGHDNSTIFKNIHHIIRDLIKQGCFAQGSYLGRLPFAGINSLKRAAISVDPERLHRMRDRITLFALESGYDPDELLRVLNFCSINAASNGYFQFESITCQKSFRVLRALPVSVRSGVLQGRYKTVKLFSAV
jgi:hypothetical protein